MKESKNAVSEKKKLILVITSLLVVALLIGTIFVPFYFPETTEEEEMEVIHLKTFSSYKELLNFIKETRAWKSYPAYYGEVVAIGEVGVMGTPEMPPTPIAPMVAEKEIAYSTTNVQVAGVDEADIVKTDGTYIYLASGDSIAIVRAFPPDEHEVVSIINLTSTDNLGWSVKGLFINNDKLIAIVSKGIFKVIAFREEKTVIPIPYRFISPNSSVLIYDISSRDEPVLLYNITVSGSYTTSRMIDKYVYVIVNYPVIMIEDRLLLPIINGEQVSPTEIKYFGRDVGFSFTIILAINIETGEYGKEIFLLGSSSHVYASPQNLYILINRWTEPYVIADRVLEAIIPMLPENLKSSVEEIRSSSLNKAEKIRRITEILQPWFNSLTSQMKEQIMRAIIEAVRSIWLERTDIYRFSLNGTQVRIRANGSVPGHVLDQFSMDEYNGYFRIATTKTTLSISGSSQTTNNVYILDMNLNIVGKLENLAAGERIYAARYLGNIMYLVTFRRIDPLFGIDLSKPTNPKVIGFLKIPGFSEYLHPYGDRYLIGIGPQTDEYGRIKGIKVSLFDISNLSDIREVSKIVLKDSTSELFHDHKAFMINPYKGYFTFPVPNGIVVVRITDSELGLKGVVEHEGARRALYIEDFIYTVSWNSIKILTEDLSIVAEIQVHK